MMSKKHGNRQSGIQRVIGAIQNRGMIGLARRLGRRVQTGLMERWLGISTDGSIHADVLGSKGVRFGYQPIDYHSFHTAMKSIDVSEDDVFADYGCGMGRAVVLAARYPLKRVFGVELSQELCEIAEQNIASSHGKLQTKDVQIICEDATRFETPDDLSILFMYNPFGADVLTSAMERVYESLVRRPRRLQIIYALPNTDDDALAATHWLKRIKEVVTENRQWERMSVYENVAHTSVLAAGDESREQEVDV